MTKTRRKTALSAGNEAPGGRHGFTKRLGSGGRLNVVWRYLSLGLECKLTFSSPVATAEFSRFAVSTNYSSNSYSRVLFNLPLPTISN